MERKQKLILLKIWEDNYKQISEVYKGLQLICDCSPESKISRAIFDTFQKYTDALAIVICDGYDWLEWYAWDNEFGKKGLQAKASSWKKEKKVKNLNDLLDLIDSD